MEITCGGRAPPKNKRLNVRGRHSINRQPINGLKFPEVRASGTRDLRLHCLQVKLCRLAQVYQCFFNCFTLSVTSLQFRAVGKPAVLCSKMAVSLIVMPKAYVCDTWFSRHVRSSCLTHFERHHDLFVSKTVINLRT